MGDSTADSQRISPTAHYTGYTWHRLGLPHSALFTTPTGRALHAAYRWVLDAPTNLRGQQSVLTRTLRNRHALIDNSLRALAPDRVVELAGGLSPRGVEFAVAGDVDYTEMDLPPMVALKRRLLERRASAELKAQLLDRWRVEAVDVLSPTFAEHLRAALAGARRPVVIAEGLVGYFGRPQQLQLLRDIATVLGEFPGDGGQLLLDLRVRTTENAASSGLLRIGILVATRGRGASPGLGSEEAALALLREGGFVHAERLPNLDDALPTVMSGVWQARAR